MFHDANETKTPENPLNDRFYRKEFQALWKRINHKYAYTVSFDSRELVRAAIDHINAELRVSRLQYTITYGGGRRIWMRRWWRMVRVLAMARVGRVR